MFYVRTKIDQNHKTLVDNELYNKSRALLPTILMLLLLAIVQLLLKETENKQWTKFGQSKHITK